MAVYEAWSLETTSLADISEHVSFPCVVRVTEGFYSGEDSSTFSLGDLLKIDCQKDVGKIRASFVEERHVSRNKITFVPSGNTVNIPITYCGRVRIIPPGGVHHEYNDIQDVLTDLPRFVKVMKPMQFNNTSLKINDTLETFPKKENQSTNSLKCIVNSKNTIHIPGAVQGSFQVIQDETEYTLQDVIERFPLPQIIQFAVKLSTNFMSSDLLATVNNAKSFEGKFKLEKVFSERLLIGHYKGVDAAPEVGDLIKRTAFVLPVTCVHNIPVEYPLGTDTSDYQFFVAKNFSETRSGTQVMNGTIYMQFTKDPNMVFSEYEELYTSIPTDDENLPPPPIPPRRYKTLPSGTKPPVVRSTSSPLSSAMLPSKYSSSKPTQLLTPSLKLQETQHIPILNPSKPSQQSGSDPRYVNLFPGSKVPSKAPKSNPVPPILKQPQQQVVKPQAREKTQRNEIKKYESISDIDWSKKASEDDFKKEDGVEKSPISFLKKTFIKFKKPSISNKPTDNPDTTDEQGEGSDDSTYDYPDLSNLNLKPTKQFHDFTVEELQEVFKVCNMPNLMKLCIKEAYDGRIFSQFSDDTLKSNPFKLKQNDLVKLQCIKEGWRPTHSNSKPQSSTKL